MIKKRNNNSKQLRERQAQGSKESGAELHILVEGFEGIVQILDQVVQPNGNKELPLTPMYD